MHSITIRLATIATITTATMLSACTNKNPPQSVTPPSKLISPSTTYLNADLPASMSTDISSWDQKQWLTLSNQYFNDKNYAKAIRAAEQSLELEDSEEARKIAMLSTLYIAKNNLETYKDDKSIDANLKNEITASITKITTAISTLSLNLNK